MRLPQASGWLAPPVVAWAIPVGIGLVAFAALVIAAAGVGPGTAAMGVYATVLIALAWTDVRKRRIPNRIVYPALAFALAAALLDGDRAVASALLGAAIAAAPFVAAFHLAMRVEPRAGVSTCRRSAHSMNALPLAGIAGAIAMLTIGLRVTTLPFAAVVAAPGIVAVLFLLASDPRDAARSSAATQARGIGGGDVKMAALVGAVVGTPDVLAALVIATVGGAAAAIMLLALSGGRGGALPYAPFLTGGGLLAMI